MLGRGESGGGPALVPGGALARAGLTIRDAVTSNSQNLLARLVWICAAWVRWFIGMLGLAQQRALGAVFRPATKWSASRSVIVAQLSLTLPCSLLCLLQEQYDAGLRIRIQGICMSMHRGRKSNCIQGLRR